MRYPLSLHHTLFGPLLDLLEHENNDAHIVLHIYCQHVG